MTPALRPAATTATFTFHYKRGQSHKDRVHPHNTTHLSEDRGERPKAESNRGPPSPHLTTKPNRLEHHSINSPAPPSSSSSSADSPRCWSQWARICSNSRRVLASRRPRLSSGLECTMLCRAAEARALAAALPRVLPRRPESLSLPCRSWISRGRQPGGGRGQIIIIKAFIKHEILSVVF